MKSQIDKKKEKLDLRTMNYTAFCQVSIHAMSLYNGPIIGGNSSLRFGPKELSNSLDLTLRKNVLQIPLSLNFGKTCFKMR